MLAALKLPSAVTKFPPTREHSTSGPGERDLRLGSSLERRSNNDEKRPHAPSCNRMQPGV